MLTKQRRERNEKRCGRKVNWKTEEEKEIEQI